MKYLFLDIDGVLNHEEWYDSQRFKLLSPTFIRWEQECFDPKCVDRIIKILKQTNAKLVISSSWRNDPELKEIFKLVGLPTKFLVTPNIIGVDENDNLIWPTRGEEIKKFLENHPCDNYVILDDDQDFLDEQQSHFIKTSADYIDSHKEGKFQETGLTDEKMNKAITILNND